MSSVIFNKLPTAFKVSNKMRYESSSARDLHKTAARCLLSSIYQTYQYHHIGALGRETATLHTRRLFRRELLFLQYLILVKLNVPLISNQLIPVPAQPNSQQPLQRLFDQWTQLPPTSHQLANPMLRFGLRALRRNPTHWPPFHS